jgi:hypothetical protein
MGWVACGHRTSGTTTPHSGSTSSRAHPRNATAGATSPNANATDSTAAGSASPASPACPGADWEVDTGVHLDPSRLGKQESYARLAGRERDIAPHSHLESEGNIPSGEIRTARELPASFPRTPVSQRIFGVVGARRRVGSSILVLGTARSCAVRPHIGGPESPGVQSTGFRDVTGARSVRRDTVDDGVHCEDVGKLTGITFHLRRDSPVVGFGGRQVPAAVGGVGG